MELDTVKALTTLSVGLDTVWVLIAAFLVFFMNLGFAMVESGLCRSKNTVNILAKNFTVFAIASISFWIVGWGLMFGNGNPFVGLTNIFFANNGVDEGFDALSWTKVPFWAKFLFQLVFAGTAATIVSGAVAERIKFLSFLIFAFILVAIMYPLTGHWIWGGGWLQAMGFWDFAGSSVVHSVGGWAALAGVIVLGPRIGKYRADGKVNPIMGHNMSMVTLGGLVLWFGWIINGALAGLVGVTAGCAFIDVNSAAIIGLVSGALAVFAVPLFDKLKLDDPVGALSVHLVNGVWGTLAVGLFAVDGIAGNATGSGLFFGGGFHLLGVQAIGVLAVGGFTFVVALVVWLVLKQVMGIRVSREEELGGLDRGEHGAEAYAGFQIID